jgi:hypothetical protein
MYVQNDWQAIRNFYARHMKRIMSCACNKWAMDPYLWDMGQHMIFMTPIEENFWADCREADLILYPQFPAKGYFIDFANPVAKVGIECDGKAFHTDVVRDMARQKALESIGWTIYRISGKDCNKDWDEDGQTPPPGRLLANQIGALHGIKRKHESSRGPVLFAELMWERIEQLIAEAEACASRQQRGNQHSVEA